MRVGNKGGGLADLTTKNEGLAMCKQSGADMGGFSGASGTSLPFLEGKTSSSTNLRKKRKPEDTAESKGRHLQSSQNEELKGMGGVTEG